MIFYRLNPMFLDLANVAYRDGTIVDGDMVSGSLTAPDGSPLGATVSATVTAGEASLSWPPMNPDVASASLRVWVNDDVAPDADWEEPVRFEYRRIA